MKAWIFDLDGVLVSTDRYHYLAWKEIADKLGIPFDEEVNSRLRGVSRMESLSIILEGSGLEFAAEEKERLAEEKNRSYRRLLARLSPEDVEEEVRATLALLREWGYRLAVGSSSKNAKYILNQVGLQSAFDAVSDGTNITRSKPDPEVFLKASEYLGVKPTDCMVVEDARAGIDAAKAANMTSVGIGDATDYEAADYRIGNFSELVDLCREHSC